MKRFRALLSMTAVRLSLAYTIVFGLFAIALIAYTTMSTTRLLRQQTQQTVNEEIQELSSIYQGGSLSRFIRVIERRSRAPGASLYLIADASGRIIAGNVRELEPGVLNNPGWTTTPFIYEGFGGDHEKIHQAIARVFELPGGLRALIGRDLGEPDRFRTIASRSLVLALLIMVLLGILTWFFVGRRALQRIDLVSHSTRRIMAGDLQQRLPLSGSGDEFDRLSVNLNQLLGRIERQDEGLKQVSDNIAHDLKTPLTRLRNKAEQALSDSSQDKLCPEAMEDIIAEADTLIKTFDALLMIARVEAGSRTGDFIALDLAAIVSDVHELYEPSADEAEVEFTVSVDGPVMISGNRELMGQTLSNLVDNAIKYATDTKTGPPVVSITIEAREGQAIISVSDNGPGIPLAERERVKERFVRLDKSRSKPGTGLGLALVDAVVRLHNGGLVLDDNNPGLKAIITIPVATGKR